jgi:hypothetical protein
VDGGCWITESFQRIAELEKTFASTKPVEGPIVFHNPAWDVQQEVDLING